MIYNIKNILAVVYPGKAMTRPFLIPLHTTAILV